MQTQYTGSLHHLQWLRINKVLLEGVTAVPPTQNQRHQIHRSRFCYVSGVGGETAVSPITLSKHPNAHFSRAKRRLQAMLGRTVLKSN
jgi:hypothetical protein